MMPLPSLFSFLLRGKLSGHAALQGLCFGLLSQLRQTTLRGVFGGLTVLSLLGCESEGSPAHYCALPAEGWERKDTLHFTTDTLRREAHYVPQLHLRHLAAPHYPYCELWLLVEQRWELPSQPNDKTSQHRPRPAYWPQLHPRHQAMEPESDSLIVWRRDTLRFDLEPPPRGWTSGGLTLHHRQLALPSLSLPAGAHGHITVSHLMDRECLPGLHDMGFEVLAP